MYYYINIGIWGIFELILGGTSLEQGQPFLVPVVPLYTLPVMPSGGTDSPGLFHFGSCSTPLVPPRFTPGRKKARRAAALRASGLFRCFF
jgi:hypothetical protein